MRIWIEVSPSVDASAYEVDIRRGSADGVQLHSHSMVRLDASPWVAAEGFDETATAPLEAAALQVTKGEKAEGLVTLLGGHLFDSLLGGAGWDRIKQVAREEDTRTVELALSWPPGETQLHAPLWEAMHDGSEFLAAHRQLTVAITRVLQTGEGEHDGGGVPPLPVPVRVLFVIGTEARDPEIRAGMEVLGLLRGAEKGPMGIDTRTIEKANVDTLAQACARFKPHIVHFVSHGRLSAAGGGELKLRAEQVEEEEWVGAGRLLAALRTPCGHVPTLAVLTGCKSAAAGGHVDPLAAELVRGGIPVVLGMAGRISDRVCRLFVRRFGVALRQGEPLVAALTAGRRAGLQQQLAPAGDDPAWALPSIYLDAEVEAGHSLIDAEGISPIVERVKQYMLDLDPVFCGRFEHLLLFDRLLDKDDELNTLVSYTDEKNEKLGKTRLLHEFAARSLRRGHLVVWIEDTGVDASLLPRTYTELAVEILKSILEARERFDLDAPEGSRLVHHLSVASDIPLDLTGADSAAERREQLGAFIHQCHRKRDTIDGNTFAGALKGALVTDLTRLAAEARSADPVSFGPAHRVVAIFGGIGKWGEVTDLVFELLHKVYGLGTADEPVPIFATASMADEADALKRVQAQAGVSDAMECQELSRFTGAEEIFAYQTVLLHPSRRRLSPNREPLSPYVPNFDKETANPYWEEVLRKELEGVPDHFRERLVLLAPYWEQSKTLLKADEEEVMRTYLEEEGAL